MDRSTLTFVTGALVCGVGWLTKQAALVATDGETTTPVSVLWALGLLGLLVATSAGAFALLRGRPTWLRALAGAAAVPLGFTLMSVVDEVAKSAYPGAGWFRDELGLVVLGTCLAVAGLLLLGRAGTARVSSPAGA